MNTPSIDVTAEKAARLAAVQALYQMEQSGASVALVKHEARADRLALGPDEDAAERLDFDLFDRIVDGVVAHQSAIDRAIAASLAANWRLDRLASVSRAILRAGAFELLHDWRADPPLVIDAYVTLTRRFFDDPEPGFVNGALDRLARQRTAGSDQ